MYGKKKFRANITHDTEFQTPQEYGWHHPHFWLAPSALGYTKYFRLREPMVSPLRTSIRDSSFLRRAAGGHPFAKQSARASIWVQSTELLRDARSGTLVHPPTAITHCFLSEAGSTARMECAFRLQQRSRQPWVLALISWERQRRSCRWSLHRVERISAQIQGPLPLRQ